MKAYPALDVRGEANDLLLAMIDDFSPTAVEEGESGVRVFFSNDADRDAARMTLASRFSVAAIDVSDEDWARRSQENLQPITVGQLTISPNPQSSGILNLQSEIRNPHSALRNTTVIVIVPSMGFGTGHHATTRLCLDALQAVDLAGTVVIDVGTGSGVLAIAADRLGAGLVFGIDNDPDAIRSACENLAHNVNARHVTFAVGDLAASPLPEADVITANLTGALLIRSAQRLLTLTHSGGTLILSGLQRHERDAVVRAFAPATLVAERAEDEWIGLTLRLAGPRQTASMVAGRARSGQQ